MKIKLKKMVYLHLAPNIGCGHYWDMRSMRIGICVRSLFHD